MEVKKLLEIKQQMKARKPGFTRYKHHTKSRLKLAWRKPRGHHSKARLQKKGRINIVKVGYGTPALVKGMHRTGIMPVLVHNVAELKLLKKDQGAILASSVGAKKRLIIIEEAKKANIPILNVKEPDKYVELIKNNFEERKKKRQEKQKKKETKKVEKKKIEKKEEKKEKTEEKTEVEKEIKEKKEKDKILATKG